MSRLVSLTLVLVTGGAVALNAAGVLSIFQAGAVILAPALLISAGLRSGWVILILIAIPPGVLARTSFAPMILLLTVTLYAQLFVRGTAYLDRKSGLYPLFALLVAAFLFKADVGTDAAFAAENFLKQFAYYVLLGLVSYNATRLGDLGQRSLSNAFLVGIWFTVLLKIMVTGLGPVPYNVGARDRPESLFLGRSFAYVAVLGFSIYFVRWISHSSASSREQNRRGSFILSLFLLVLVGLSLVRGAWVAALLVVLFVAGHERRRAYWVVIPLAVALALVVPGARERVIPSQSASTDITTGRWQLWSIVWSEEAAPALPWGNGFGHAWSLHAEDLFGFVTFRFDASTSGVVYLHNDFLFWLVEFGILGLLLFVLYWRGVIRVVRKLLSNPDAAIRAAALLFIGTIVSMLVVHVIANGYALRPLAERSFVASGFLFGLLARDRLGLEG
ncbi:MAG: O-antigen ligase family protein [bacterium]